MNEHLVAAMISCHTLPIVLKEDIVHRLLQLFTEISLDNH